MDAVLIAGVLLRLLLRLLVEELEQQPPDGVKKALLVPTRAVPTDRVHVPVNVQEQVVSRLLERRIYNIQYELQMCSYYYTVQ